MFGECHAHALMNGVNYRAAVESTQRRSQRKSSARMPVRHIRKQEFLFVRDGGDPYGVANAGSQTGPGSMGLIIVHLFLLFTKTDTMGLLWDVDLMI